MKSSFKLPIFITLCHLPLLLLKIGEIQKKPIKKKIALHTVHLIEEPSKYIKKQTHTAAQVKKSSPRPPAPKKKITKKAPPKKKKVKKVKKEAKKKLQKAINKSLSKNKTHAKKSSPKKVVKKDAGKASNEYNLYLQEVTEILTDSLTLPETGKVKLAITVHPKGKIVKIVSLFSESADNLSYLEKNLGNLTLPKYKTNEERTFNITFSDEK